MSILYCFTFLGYIDNCLSFENVFLCLHVRLIYALNYYLLTYLLIVKLCACTESAHYCWSRDMHS